MATNTLKTRLLLKIDTLTNWNASQLPLKKGEVAFATASTTVETTEGIQRSEPVVMMKICTEDGKKFSELPWALYAKAADVLDVCKNQTELDGHIRGIINERGGVADKVGAFEILLEEFGKTLEDHGHVAADITDLKDTVDGYGYALATEMEKALEALQENIDKVLAKLTAGDNSITIGGTATEPTVAVKVSAATDNALTLASDGLKVVIPAAAEYSVVKDATAENGYSATYHLTKGGVNVGAAINIPKDMVVQSGSVVTNPAGQAAGTYIKLVLANADNSELYINVGNLIEYVTSGSDATNDSVVISVSDDHKVTATIRDKSIALGKLEQSVQDKINQAHTHGNKALLDTYTQTEANLKDAVDKKHDHGNKTVLDGITSELVSQWNTAYTQQTTVVIPKLNKLHAIAESGNVNDLVQTDGDELILDCGNSGVTNA